MPLMVISATRRSPLEAAFAADFSAMQKELAAQLPAAQHLIARGSGHYVQRDEPGIVIGAIRKAVQSLP